MFDIPLNNMEPTSNEFKLGRGSGQKILNAENHLTFSIQVLEENHFSSYPSQVTTAEPTISVVKDEIEEEDFISHEIVDEQVALTVNNLTVEKGHFHPAKDGLNPVSSQDDSYGSAHDDDSQWTVPHIPVEDVFIHCPNLTNAGTYKTDEGNDTIIKFNVKEKRKSLSLPKCKLQNGCKLKKEMDVMSIVLKNMAKYQKKNYSGMKMMVDPKSGKHIIRSTYIKSSSRESFTVEPWMLEKTSFTQEPKEKLFLMSKHTKFNAISNAKGNSCTNCKLSGFSKGGGSQLVHSVERGACAPNIHFKKEESEEVQHNSSAINHSKMVHWEEGNIDTVSNYNTLSSILRNKYSKSEKQNQENTNFEFIELLSDISTYESPVATTTGAAFGIRTFLSWEAVKERIEELQEETMTKFTLDYRSPKFKDDPEPFKKIHIDLNTIRKEIEVVIPNSGIPFIYIGICVYSCHLGKRKLKPKDSLEEDLNKPLKTKRIGCPAVLAISRIARFPDYDISDLSPNCEADVLNELKDAWDFDTARVRYYIEYHVREPKPSDHKGHELQYLVNSNRLKEPVDPRIVEKIRDLTRQGHTGVKVIHQKLEEFIREELFKGEENPPLHRRRYNPSRRDIRYAIYKAKEELKREGKSMVQIQCSALASEISQMVKDITHEQYLNQLKAYLTVLRKTIRSEEPLDSLFTFSTNNHTETQAALAPTPTVPITFKKAPKRRRAEASLLPASGEGDFLVGQPTQMPEQVMEQLYINMVPETSEGGVFGAAQLYAQELVDMNAGLADALPPVQEDTTVTEVYYYYPDGTCELAIPEALSGVQT